MTLKMTEEGLFTEICTKNRESVTVYPHESTMRGSPSKGIKITLTAKKDDYHIVSLEKFINHIAAGDFDDIAGAPCYLTKFRDSCRLNSFTYAANGRCPERPASVTTTHKSRFVITPSNGWTAIRNAILASLARYRALRLSELPCRLSGTKNHHFASAPFP